MPSGHVIQRINVPNLQKNGQETVFATWKLAETAMDPMLAMFLTEMIAKVSKQLSRTRALLNLKSKLEMMVDAIIDVVQLEQA